ncbi:MAG: DMT family transporter [Clostridiales bacterium]|nr:DMT family transporter [Clostridiales bacterium]
MWFGLSLVAILFWSLTDLFSKAGSKREDKYSHWKMAMMVGFVMGIHALIMILLGEEFRLRDMLTYFPASAMYILAMVIGYVGLRYLYLSLSSPICNSSGAVAAILCFFLLGERLAVWQYVGVGMIVASVFALSVTEKVYETRERRLAGAAPPDRKYTHSFLAILLPVLYCIIDALGTYADGLLLYEYDDDGTIVSGVIAEGPANIAYELTFLLIAVFAFIYVVIIKKQRLSLRYEMPKIGGALCETAGQFAYIYAIAQNTMAAAPLISSYCVLSLVWARVFLKEKLTWVQYVFIALAAAGIVVMGIEV